MPRRKSEQPKQSVSLHIGSSFASAWESVLLPWFEAAALASLESNETVAVVTPFPSGAAFLRSKLLEHKIPLLGVKFITPARLREMLLSEQAASLPLREHLRLLLANAAESIATRASEDVDLAAIAKSISRSPDNLLRTFDQVSAAGWDFQNIAAPAAREIIQQFQKLVRQSEFKLVHEADRDALAAAKKEPPRFSHLLLVGFTAKHWPLWPLLQAAVSFANCATVVLEYPREQTRSADESWIGTWEEHFDSAAPIADPPERERPFIHLNQPSGSETTSEKRREPQFLVGLNATEQAQAICAIALNFLADKSCTRLGILFPRAGALARLVSEFLTRSGIPNHDAIGHLAPGEFEEPAWNAWLHLQENHQLEPVLRFLETNPDSTDGMSIQEIRENLRWAHRQILIDDINVLREFCARQKESAKFARIAKMLRSIAFLPSEATLQQFLSETKPIFSKLKWDNRWTEIERFAQGWSAAASAEFSRAIYLRWLKEILDSFTIARAPQAAHVYSRVHLLSYGEADGHEWSHLILAGLNQGEWPQSQRESGFLSDAEIVDLNARATRRGRQGEGHSALAKDKTFLLSAQDERQITLRQFSAALESAEHGLAITASLLQESAPERVWNPSELFSQAYFVARNAPLSQETMSILQEKTSAWLKEHALIESTLASDASVDQTRVAYEARRTADVPFGEYEFALRDPIGRKITLATTEWQRVVKTPALIWLKTFLGVENQEPDLNQWNAATGTWVHDWLAKIAASEERNALVDFPTADQMCERIEDAAHRFQKTIIDLCRSAGRTVPDWWSSGWSNALTLADFLASKLAEVSACPRMAAEWRLESPQLLSLKDGTKLRVRGRIDLILAQTQPTDSRLTGADVWIVDYKTGNQKPLTPPGRTPEARAANLRKKLVRGDAIQLGLYGLAARELGAADIHLSILSLRTELDRPQLDMSALAADSEFWAELYRMQETGIFGLRGLIRNEFGFNPDYPIATLPIDKEFLDEKWVLTHPAFADDEDDRS
jgi:hypothetical protein